VGSFSRNREEQKIQDDLVSYLEARNWLVERLIGNAFQRGIPDLYTFRSDHGGRWIDVKVEGKYTFTKAQRIKWPKWERFGLGIYILTGADQANYDKLFAPPNWRDYWKPQWELPDVDALLDEMGQE
jgi:hypothetical protein